MKRVYNCIESHDQHQDWSLQKAKALGLSARKKVIPASKDLREPWWNVGDQGETGSCVGWALADSVLRYHFVKARKLRKHEHISVRYIWMAAKEMDHKCKYPTTFLDDAGTSPKTALQLVRKIGALKSSVLPFEGGLVKLREQHFLSIAGRLKVRAFFNLCGKQSGKLDRFKEWLACHGPILARLRVDSTWNAVGSDGRLEKYDRKKANGGHCVSIVGYTPTHFIVRNSWGADWGHHGFAYSSYAYAADAFNEAYGVVV
jgi:Papain family cysteine protease